MHCRRRALLPLVHGPCSQVRSTATASKPKPRTWDSPLIAHEPAIAPLAPIPSKWARREQSLTPSTSKLPPSRPRSSSQGLGQWARSPPPSSSGLAKWTPREPPSSSLDKFPQPQKTHEPVVRPRPYTPRNDPRLQRDLAPHQVPSGIPTSDSPAGTRGRHAGVRRDDFSKDSLDLKRGRPDRDISVERSLFGLLSREESHRGRSASGQPPSSQARVTSPSWKSATREENHSPNFDEKSNTLRKDSRGSRQDRGSYKSRGSLVSRIHEGSDIIIPSHHKAANTRASHETTKLKKERQSRRARVTVYIPSLVTVGTLARLLKVRLERLQRKMSEAGMGKESSYDHVLTSDYAILLAEEFGRQPIVNDEAAFDIYPSPPHPKPSTLPSRPPIVTIMGHVDHGKTTLLDTLRSASVAAGEAGGITQHIGAFSVPVPASGGGADEPRTITFLDTPGHAAFSAMRARGAGVTDIVVLVVAADDGVMPQTREVIELIKKDEGKVGVIVAINKVDKPGIDVSDVHMALMAEGIQLEALGGDIPSVEVSGLTGQGMSDLTETLSAMAEMQDLRAERDGLVHGYVLESKVQKGLGPIATVLVLRGCLKLGAHIISGTCNAKVRVMTDSAGTTVKTAFPAMAVTVSGWKELPNAGDEVLQGSEADVKKAVVNRVRKANVEATLVDVEAINISRREERERKEAEEARARNRGDIEMPDEGQTREKEAKELRLIIKGDVSGSVEAVEGAVQGIGNKEAVVKVVSTGVGDVTESDVMMAKAVEGMIVAFSVATPRAVEAIANQNSVPLYSSSIIYRLLDDIKSRVIALLPATVERRVTGEATVLQLFDIQVKSKQTKKVAGCRVVNGLVEKARSARVIRNGHVIHEGSLDTLRYMKKDVPEVRKGSECGVSLSRFDDLREGDLIQLYNEMEIPGVL